LVVLDTAAGQYYSLPEGAQDAILACGGRAVEIAEPGLVADWLASGLAVRGAAVAAPALPRLPTAGFGRQISARPNWREVLRLTACVLDLAVHYRGRSFGQILDHARRGHPAASIVDAGAEVLRLARVFDQARIWLPVPSKCLVQSFLLLRFLQRSGVSARWVFGVRTWPFAAHCWLQAGEVVLDDAPERLTAFVPILAV
jgi:hypothetical protein